MVDEVIAALVRQIQTQLVHIERVGPPAVQAFLESLRPKASATENLAAMPNESRPQAQCSIASGFFQFLGDGVCCLLDGLGCFGLIGHSRLRSVLVYHINWRLFSGLGRCAALPSGCGSVGGPIAFAQNRDSRHFRFVFRWNCFSLPQIKPHSH